MKKSEIDIHGMTVSEAQAELDYYLEYLDEDITEVKVIHGYHNGKRLLKMVREEFTHERIERIFVSMNPGITILNLKH